LANTKKEKQAIVTKYGDWLDRSQALVLTKYIGLTVADFDKLRREVRDAGGEFHVVKNTLAKLAFEKAGLEYEDEYFVGDTAIGFAYDDPPGLAKAITEFAEDFEFVKLKAGYLDKTQMTPEDIKALATVPPLPVLRSMLLSTLLAPATKLVRTVSEPGRQIAGVLQAYADKDAAA
jgi:large subunit ribosomal protein L10